MKNTQSGFVLAELLVVLAISSVIVGGVGATAIQALRVTQQNGDRVMTVRQSQNLGSRASQDLLMARVLSNTDDLATPETEIVTMTWKDWQTGDMYEVRYIWPDPSDPERRVMRQLTVRDKAGAWKDGRTALVADNILSANVTAESSYTWALTVESQSGKKNVTREYDITKRIGQ